MVKELFAKIAGGILGRKLKLQEGTMEDKKKWYQSKTVLSAIVVVIIGAYDLARINLAPQIGWNLPEIPGWVLSLLGGIGIYSRVTASKTIE